MPPRFGDAGQWVIDQRFLVAAAQAHASPFVASSQSIHLAPSAARFVLRRFSVGLGIPFAYDRLSVSGQGLVSTRTSLGISPRVGYAVPLGKSFSLWPELGATVAKAWVAVDYQAGNAHSTTINVALFAGLPLLWHPTEHFFVGVGPNFQWTSLAPSGGALTSSARSVGVSSLIGGYFSG